MTHRLEKYVQYIRNTGQIPLRVSQFDDNWEPIGPQIRRDLAAAGMIEQSGGRIYLPGDVYLDQGAPHFRYLGEPRKSREERLQEALEMIVEDIKFRKKLGLLDDRLDEYVRLGESVLKDTKP